MSTTPVTPTAQPAHLVATPAPEPVKHPILQASEAIVAHHPIIALVIIGVLIYGLAGKAESMWATHEETVFNQQNANLQEQASLNANAAATSAADAEKNAALAAQYAAMVKQYQAELATLQAQVAKQKGVDATLPPNELAARWETLAKINDQVHPVAGGTYSVTQAGAVATTQALEDLPMLNAEVANDEKLLATQDGLVTGLNTQIADQKTQITGLQKQIGDEVTTCTAAVNKAVADERSAQHKSKTNWIIAALAAGFGLGLRVH